MAQEKFCQDCNQKHDCRKIYEQLGNVKGPSVVFKVIVAFLLPVVVFIASLVAFERILAGVIDTKGSQTVLGFLLALSAALVCVLIIKAINKRPDKNR